MRGSFVLVWTIRGENCVICFVDIVLLSTVIG